jgi:hypothetical protein
VAALAFLALTLALGVAAYGDLPAEMVVGWRVGLDGESSQIVRAINQKHSL